MERFNAVETAELRPLRTKVAEFPAFRYSFYEFIKLKRHSHRPASVKVATGGVYSPESGN